MAEDEWWGGAHLWGHADPRIEPLSLKCHSALLVAAVTDTLINVDLIMDEAQVEHRGRRTWAALQTFAQTVSAQKQHSGKKTPKNRKTHVMN